MLWRKTIFPEAVFLRIAFVRLVRSGECIVIDGAQASAGAAGVSRAEGGTELHRNCDSMTHLVERK